MLGIVNSEQLSKIFLVPYLVHKGVKLWIYTLICYRGPPPSHANNVSFFQNIFPLLYFSGHVAHSSRT